MSVQDPYKVLGVSPNATEEEIKSAYRDLVKKYHPDNYADSPLADLANEKMQEINEAYDMITKRLRNGSSQQSGGYYQQSPSQQAYGPSYGAGYGNSAFADVRRMIQQGRITDAEELLDGTPMQARDAEWYFLKGIGAYKMDRRVYRYLAEDKDGYVRSDTPDAIANGDIYSETDANGVTHYYVKGKSKEKIAFLNLSIVDFYQNYFMMD